MKKNFLHASILIIAVVLDMQVWAYDGSVTLNGGNTIYYTFNSDSQSITICRPSNEYPYWTGFTKPTGTLIIPSLITHNGTEYPVTRIGSFAFFRCSDLTSVSIPNTVNSIYNSAFSDCTGLVSVLIPNSVNGIGTGAFYGCSNLTSVTIPNMLSILTDDVFMNCSNLVQLTSLAENPPIMRPGAFDGINANIIIIIPCGTTSSYQTTDGWSGFTNYQEEFVYTIETPDSEQGHVDIVRPTCQQQTATLTAIPDDGYVFSHWSDNITENPRTLAVTSDTSITAFFVAAANPPSGDDTFTVVANNAVGGGTYPSGSTAVVFALPQVDLQFAGWSDGETTNPRYIVVTSDTTLTALYRTPDTVRIYDTTTVYDTVINIVYDTTEYKHYFYDTTRVYDTLIVYDTTRIFDTLVYVNIDTINHYYFDTTRVLDTMIVYDTTRIFDTLVFVNIDTLHHYYFDTTRVFDTMVYVNIDTLNHYYYDTTRVYETILSLDTVFHYYYDTTHTVDTLVFYDTTAVTHHVFDSTWVFDSVWVFDTIYLSDTVFYFDTVYIEVPVQGVDGVEKVNVKVYTYQTRIIVEGAQNMMVRLYDVNGRLLATSNDDRQIKHFYVQTSGTYLVRVGDHIAKKVVVIR